MVASDIKLRLRENVKKFQLIDIIFLSTYCGQHIKVMSGMMHGKYTLTISENIYFVHSNKIFILTLGFFV